MALLINLSCNDRVTKMENEKAGNITTATYDTQSIVKTRFITVTTDSLNKVQTETLNIPPVSREELVSFAKTLIGVPYLYASTDPSKGFDCSGFITYVFNHFSWPVPRSSVDFTNVGKQVDQLDAQPGDLILFTGTNDSIRIVGHMGIITENTDTLKFIHSTSGRANAVTISELTEHYRKRFVKITRIFPD